MIYTNKKKKKFIFIIKLESKYKLQIDNCG